MNSALAAGVRDRPSSILNPESFLTPENPVKKPAVDADHTQDLKSDNKN